MSDYDSQNQACSDYMMVDQPSNQDIYTNNSREDSFGANNLRSNSRAVKYKKSPGWTPSEDDILQNLIQKLGIKRWQYIAAEVNSKVWGGEQVRKGKQCRERWINHLNPEVKKGSFTPSEEVLMLEKQMENGNRWALIATFLHGRTENQVKNRFKHILKKFVEGKYGKEYFQTYSKEALRADAIVNIDKKDIIIEELLEQKKLEAVDDPAQVSNNISGSKIKVEDYCLSHPSHENNLFNNASAFKQVSSNFMGYSRNVQKLQQYNSQPHYLNLSMEAMHHDFTNLNVESSNLNNSMVSKKYGYKPNFLILIGYFISSWITGNIFLI